MYPAAVVKDFDVIEDFIFRCLPRGKAFVVDEFGFQDAEEAFRAGIVPTVALPTHALSTAPQRQSFGEALSASEIISLFALKDGSN